MKVELRDDTLHFEIDSGTKFSRPANEDDLARFPHLFAPDGEVDYDAMSMDDLRALAAQRGVQFNSRAKKATLVKRLREDDEPDA